MFRLIVLQVLKDLGRENTRARSASGARAVLGWAFIPAGAFYVVILPDDRVVFLLPTFGANVSGTAGADLSQTRKRVSKECDLRLSLLGKLGVCSSFLYKREPNWRKLASQVMGGLIKKPLELFL